MKPATKNMKKLLKWISYYNLDIGTTVCFRKSKTGGQQCYITTARHEYCISAHTKGKGYLGCVYSNRYHSVNEDWTRGGDLPDGIFSKHTFISILAGIVRTEARNVT